MYNQEQTYAVGTIYDIRSLQESSRFKAIICLLAILGDNTKQ